MAVPEFKADDLPSMPQVVGKIIQIDENNIDVSSDQLQSLIAVDPALTTKILKIANSAFYARTSKVANLSEAVTLLGFRTIKSLTLLVSAKDLFPARKEYFKVQKELWMRSVLTALISKIIAEKIGQRNIQEEIFMAGLLKNIGQLILLNKFPASYSKFFAESEFATNVKKLNELEDNEFAITSIEVSVLTMQKWNFPKEFVKTAEFVSYNQNQLKKKSGVIEKIVALSEAIVLLNKLTENAEITDAGRKRIAGFFLSLSKKLEITEETQNYMVGDLEKDIKNDSFYSFCSELFSS